MGRSLPGYTIYPWRGGGIEAGVVWCADPDDHPAARVWGGGRQHGGQADPSQQESERELGPHTTGYSSELEN
jgi:hypothetical protein